MIDLFATYRKISENFPFLYFLCPTHFDTLFLASSTTYGLSCSAGMITTTNQRIIREREKRQKDAGTAVDLSVSYEDNIATYCS